MSGKPARAAVVRPAPAVHRPNGCRLPVRQGAPPAWAEAEVLEGRRLLSAGDPDLTFGTAGTAAVDLGFGSGPETGSFQLADMDTRGGKTIAVGDVYGIKHQLGMIAVRLNADGSPDASFGGTGQFMYGDYSPDLVAIQPDGKTLVAARRRDGPEVDAPFTTPDLIRLNADGGFDTTFGDGGIVHLPLRAGALAVGSAGAIYVGGSYANGGEIMVVKYLPTGAPDAGFGQSGQYSLEEYRGLVRGMSLQSDGGVVVVGPMTYTPIVEGGPDKPSGQALVKFGGGGGAGWGTGRMVFLPAGYDAGSLAREPDDQLVVGTMQGGNVRPLRYNADGTPDRAFAALPRGGGGVTDVRVATDGRVIAFADGGTDTADGSAVAVRYNADGTLDKTFAPGLGYRPVAGPQGDLQADNQVLAVGTPDVGHVGVGRYDYAAGSDPVHLAPSGNGTLTLNGTIGGDVIRIAAGALAPGGPIVWRVRLNGYFRGLDPAKVKRVTVDAGSGDDLVHLGAVRVPTTVFGGNGNDILVGGFAADTLDGQAGRDLIHGGAGNDTLRGGSGDDALFGDAGDDRLDGGTGADDLWGGGGTDTLDYGSRTRGVSVTLAGGGDDGEVGERDYAHPDVEVVVGGAGNDTIVGTAANNIFYGNGGDDVLRGGGGDDILTGGPGRDKLYGDAGNDRLFARDGFADLLDGGAGYDTASRDPADAVAGVEKFT